MEIQIAQKEFLKALYIAQGVVEKRPTRPILANLLLEAHPDKGLTLSATDLEISLSTTLEAEILQEGSTTVSARDLYDVVRKLPEQPLRLGTEEENTSVTIHCGRIFFRLHTLPAEEYPELPETEMQGQFNYRAEHFFSLIEHTLFAVATDESRYYLGGVFLELKPGENLRTVATDGHRLALAEHTAPEDFLLPEGVILPRKVLSELRKALSDLLKPSESREELQITIGFQNNHVVFRYGSTTLLSLLVEGNFPDYQQVLPASPSHHCRVRRTELLEALKRVSVISQEKSWGIRLALTPKTIVISSQNAGRGEGRQEVEVIEGGGEMEIGFNAHYLIDVLQILKTDEVLLDLTDTLSPCILRPYYDEGEAESKPPVPNRFVSVVMPMRI
jgi:DNA polymerase III subunit beta